MRELKETTIVEGTGALKKHRGCWKGAGLVCRLRERMHSDNAM